MRFYDFVRTPSLDREQLLALAHGTLVADAPEELPRLPAPPMLMLDRVTSIERGESRGRIVAERDIHPDDWYFKCHFLGDPLQPGSLGFEAVMQLVGLYCAASGACGSLRALGCKELELTGEVRPTDGVVRYEVDIRRFMKRDASAVAIGDGAMFVDGRPIGSIEAAKVGVFRGAGYSAPLARSAPSSGERSGT
jgi:3-hydroxyacyl-[acyl-carrier protein] dehydratase/trans-2-decenoyl-[acyl-carrier protein] isomerase